MAGAFWHFYIANRAIEALADKLEQQDRFRCILNYRSQYLAGAQGPDFNFYPGGDGAISSLAHGDRPADLGRSLLRLAANEPERAFAYGWLMHLTTDTITHPLVNRLILDHFPGKTKNGTDPKAYPLGHHRVEWGIDVALLQIETVVPYLPNLTEVLHSAIDLSPFAGKALLETFDYALIEEDWKGSISGMLKFISFFEKAWNFTGRITDDNRIRQKVKELGYYSVVNPLAKLIALRNPENGAGVFIPIRPLSSEIDAVLERAEQVLPAFEDYLESDFSQLPNDTG
jgi:hypothetical protein